MSAWRHKEGNCGDCSKKEKRHLGLVGEKKANMSAKDMERTVARNSPEKREST